MDAVSRAAVERVEQAGIIFVDEIDKIAGREGSHGPDVSREGVQRDILPIVEGTTVNTKHGMVRTDHILFIAAGAFHVSKPSDLIPELQGRFPIRVELDALGQAEFVRILTEPRSALIKQYIALMATEGVELTFTDDAIASIAEFATIVNERTENIGARRLHTVMERLLDEISFEAPDLDREDRLRLTPPTCAACSPTSCRTKTCRATSCEQSVGSHSRRQRKLLDRGPAARRGARRRLRQERAAAAAASCGMPAAVARASTAQRVGDDVYLSVHGARRRTSTASRRPTSRASRSTRSRRRAPPADRCRRAARSRRWSPPMPVRPILPRPAGQRTARRRRRSRCRPAGVDQGADGRRARDADAGRARRRSRCRDASASSTATDRHRASASGPLVAPPPTPLPRRYYFVVAREPARPR